MELRLYTGEDYRAEEKFLSLSLEREAYTPYASLSARVLASEESFTAPERAELWRGESCLFRGIPDVLTWSREGGRHFLVLRARSFSAALMQNELAKGLYTDLTLEKLLTGFYTFPFVTGEEYEGSGYINVTGDASVWECLVRFGYKMTGHYPYVTDDCVHLSLPQSHLCHVILEKKVTSIGVSLDTRAMISHFHMEEADGSEDAYTFTNPGVPAGIVRHRFLPFDAQFVHNPPEALAFRAAFSCRAARARTLTYTGFDNEQIGDTLLCGERFPEGIITRVRAVFTNGVFRTSLWCYEDGFYPYH